MFLSCHNYWIVCRLVRDDTQPYLAYSPLISIEGSSEPFRAFLGAILSVIESVPVEPSVYSPDMELDIITEEHDDGPLPEHDIDDGSGDYQGDSNPSVSTGKRLTRSHYRTEDVDAESKLIVRLFLGIDILPRGYYSSYRLLRPRPIRLNISKYGLAFPVYRTTHASTNISPEVAKSVSGSPDS